MVGGDAAGSTTDLMTAGAEAQLRFLRRIEHAVFPLVITDSQEIIEAEKLALSGMVSLDTDGFAGASSDHLKYQELVILKILPSGGQALRRAQTLGPWEWRVSGAERRR